MTEKCTIVLLGLFRKRIDIKNAEKTTYSEENLEKLIYNFQKEFTVGGEKRIFTPFRKETPRAWDTQMREMAFESVLDNHTFTFKHLLVIPNPYGVSVQTALVLFNTSEECSVRYRVRGKNEEDDFVGETEVTTRHRVPIFGLYKGFTNKLVLELLDKAGNVIKRRDLTIYARDIPLNMQNIVTKVEKTAPSDFPFVLVNGVKFNPIAFDHHGEPRYSLQMKTDKKGMIPLKNGHFLYGDASQNVVGENGNPLVCQYHEMDYFGRIHRTYLMAYPIEPVACGYEDSLFLLSASDKKHKGDFLVELDRNTGQAKKSLDLQTVLGDKYRDCPKWAPVTSMQYLEGRLYLTIKKMHTILALNWEKQEVEWVLAPKSIWRETPLEQYLLQGENGIETYGYVIESGTVEMLENRHLQLEIYCVQNRGLIPADNAEASEDSKILFYEIDVEKKCFQVKKDIDVVKIKRFGSCLYDKEDDRILSMAGCLVQQSDNLKACLEELDGQTGDMINRLRLCKVFRGAWRFEPDILDCSKRIDKKLDVVFGKLPAPKPFDGELTDITDEKLKKMVFGNTRICGKLFVAAFYPSIVEKVYFIGENHKYVQDYSSLKLKRRKINFVTALDELACDEYMVYVEYDGKIYQLKNEIRIEKAKKEVNGGK